MLPSKVGSGHLKSGRKGRIPSSDSLRLDHLPGSRQNRSYKEVELRGHCSPIRLPHSRHTIRISIGASNDATDRVYDARGLRCRNRRQTTLNTIYYFGY